MTLNLSSPKSNMTEATSAASSEAQKLAEPTSEPRKYNSWPASLKKLGSFAVTRVALMFKRLAKTASNLAGGLVLLLGVSGPWWFPDMLEGMADERWSLGIRETFDGVAAGFLTIVSSITPSFVAWLFAWLVLCYVVVGVFFKDDGLTDLIKSRNVEAETLPAPIQTIEWDKTIDDETVALLTVGALAVPGVADFVAKVNAQGRNLTEDEAYALVDLYLADIQAVSKSKLFRSTFSEAEPTSG